MIRTVTLNSGFDEVFTVSDFSFGSVSNLLSHDTLPSGKGFNAARIVRALGDEVMAYGLVGESDCDEFSSRLDDEGLSAVLVRVPGRTRRNLTILDTSNSGPTAHFRAPGFVLDSDFPFRELLNRLDEDIQPGDLVTINGSTPIGLPNDAWAKCGQLVQQKGARLLVDVSGEPLRIILEKCSVLACKPNEDEMVILSKSHRDRDESARNALSFMSSHGVTLPIVTLGKDGLRFVLDNAVWDAFCEVEGARILVGSGDACMAGLVVGFARHSEPASLSKVVRFAVATATAHVLGTRPETFTSEVERLESFVRLVH